MTNGHLFLYDSWEWVTNLINDRDDTTTFARGLDPVSFFVKQYCNIYF